MNISKTIAKYMYILEQKITTKNMYPGNVLKMYSTHEDHVYHKSLNKNQEDFFISVSNIHQYRPCSQMDTSIL